MLFEEAKEILERNGYEVIDEGLGAQLATVGLCLAMALGVRACNGSAANSALEDIHTMSGNGATLFQEYNSENWAGSLSAETAHAKAMFAAVIKYAQQHHMSVAQAAKEMKGQFASSLRNQQGLVNKVNNGSRITSVVTTTDGDEEIVVVSFRYKEGSDEHSHYVSSEVIIPANAADMSRPHEEKPQPAAERPAPSRSSAEQEAMAKGASGWRP